MPDFVAIDVGKASSSPARNPRGQKDNAAPSDAIGSIILGTTITTVSEGTPLLSQNSETSSVRTVQVLPGMQLRPHLIDSKATVRSISTTKEALNGSRKRRGHYWIDIDADTSRDRDELRDWLEQLHCIPPFFMALLAEPTWFSEVVALRGCVLAVIRILPVVKNISSNDSCCNYSLNGGEDKSSITAANPFQLSDEHGAVHMAALTIGKNLLLTFTSGPKTDSAGLYNAVIGYMHERERLPDASSSGCLVAWLRFHLDRTSRLTRELAAYVVSMDESMDRNIKSVTLEEIVHVKDQLLRLLSVAEEQQESIESLAGVAQEPEPDSLDFQRLRGALSVLLSKTSATQRMALRLEKQIAELRGRLDNHQQERLNRRLAVLTVLSAIFLPLTLITGVWGMSTLLCSCVSSKYRCCGKKSHFCRQFCRLSHRFSKHARTASSRSISDCTHVHVDSGSVSVWFLLSERVV